MDQPIELRIEGNLSSLASLLEMQLEQPVIINDRAIKYAQLEPGSQLQYETRSEPLRTALRKLLAPLGLKATDESERLVITADHSELVHRDIGTDQWTSWRHS